MKRLRIAVDYDDTYTADPDLFIWLINFARAGGHEVAFVTSRSENVDNDDIKRDAMILGIDIIFCGAVQKHEVYPADIWIDDSPITIPTIEAMTSYLS